MTVHMLRGNPLQIRIPAHRTMRMQQLCQRHQSCMKAGFALAATPRIHTHYAEEIVRSILATRTARVRALTDWAIHRVTRGTV